MVKKTSPNSPRKVIFLYSSTGHGHYHVAQVVEKRLKQLVPSLQALSADLVQQEYPATRSFLKKVYLSIIKFIPNFWGFLHQDQTVYETSKPIRRAADLATQKRFLKTINQFQPDLIVCTNAFSASVCSLLKKQKKISQPIVAVITDFIAHNYWIHPLIDLYCVSSELAKKKLKQRAVPSSRIRITGIPIDPNFSISFSDEEKKALRKKFGFGQEPVLLLVGGSLGLINFPQLIKDLDKSSSDFSLIAVCGRNYQMKKKLAKINLKNRKLVVRGYVNNLHQLMSISTLLVGKAGGSICSEALAKSLPILALNYIPGQESSNVKFLEKKGVLIDVKQELDEKVASKLSGFPSLLSRNVEELLSLPQKIEQMKKQAQKLAQPYSADKVARLLLEKLKIPLS